ncbi:hypothetical protein LTS18_001151, partial [Coniosporium uncinatum]
TPNGNETLLARLHEEAVARESLESDFQNLYAAKVITMTPEHEQQIASLTEANEAWARYGGQQAQMAARLREQNAALREQGAGWGQEKTELQYEMAGLRRQISELQKQQQQQQQRSGGGGGGVGAGYAQDSWAQTQTRALQEQRSWAGWNGRPAEDWNHQTRRL